MVPETLHFKQIFIIFFFSNIQMDISAFIFIKNNMNTKFKY